MNEEETGDDRAPHNRGLNFETGIVINRKASFVSKPASEKGQRLVLAVKRASDWSARRVRLRRSTETTATEGEFRNQGPLATRAGFLREATWGAFLPLSPA